MGAAESELFADPDYLLWDGESQVQIGCRQGGFIQITPATLQDTIRFVDCAFVPDFTLTGSGSYVFASNAASWSVAVPGGQLDYLVTADGRHVSGTWKGKPVDLTR